MPLIEIAGTTLVAIDFQTRLMPVIADAPAVLANARRLLDAAYILEVPTLITEQNPSRLGAMVPELLSGEIVTPRIAKMCFDAGHAAGLMDALQDCSSVIVMGCETHVCVLQTVLGLLETGRRVHVVRDAVGSRLNDNRDAALTRMERHGAEVVTTEMVVFEWLGTAEHPRFRDVIALIK